MEGGRKIWNVLMADRLRRIRRFCLGFVSLEMRFHAVKSIRGGQSNVSVCVCVFFHSSSSTLLHLFFVFVIFRETGRATMAGRPRPRRVFQFTLYRGQIAR